MNEIRSISPQREANAQEPISGESSDARVQESGQANRNDNLGMRERLGRGGYASKQSINPDDLKSFEAALFGSADADEFGATDAHELPLGGDSPIGSFDGSMSDQSQLIRDQFNLGTESFKAPEQLVVNETSVQKSIPMKVEAAIMRPSQDTYAVADMVKQVTRTLAHRDLQDLSAGRDIVLKLDDRIIPQTTLSLRAASMDINPSADAHSIPFTVSLTTESAAVEAFLNVHGHELINALAKEIPGMKMEIGERSLNIDESDSSGASQSDSRKEQSSQQDQQGRDGRQFVESLEDVDAAVASVKAVENVVVRNTLGDDFERIVTEQR